ncbi:MAG: sulfate ABC transporter substrate-binding protein [Nocardioides sp.]
MKLKLTAATLAAAALALTACGSDSSADSGEAITIVGYSVLQAANAGVIDAFKGLDGNDGVDFSESYAASGDQARAVIAGQQADEVHLSLEPDVLKLVDEGLVAEDWKDNDTAGICTTSVVVLVVRTGNPKDITDWSDLTEPGIQIVTPNPASSGSAKWNLLAAYGSAQADGQDPDAYMSDFFANIVSMPDSGRDATTAFTSGTGDVLLSYENEAILARQSATDFDYVVPDTTLLIENPCALVEGATEKASEFMDFQKSAEGQALYAGTGYRPITDIEPVTVDGANDPADPFPAPGTLLTIDDDFGGWAQADTEFFDETDGTLTKLRADSGL